MQWLFNIVWLVSLCFSFSFAVVDERKTDIYFGNGVWNSKKEANVGREELDKFIQREIIKNNPNLLAKYGQVKLQYNWGKGNMLDVLETYYQLKEAGQVNHLEFFAVIAVLTKGNIQLSATATAALMASMPFVGNTEQNNVDEMYTKYYEESLQWSHRILLVSHSQGNMFANRIYDTLNPTQYQDYFANVQIASPASHVHAKMGEHITNRGDMIINPIPGSMSGNSDPNLENRLNITRQNMCVDELMDGNFSNTQECLKYVNHEFVPAYLGQSDPFQKILIGIKNKLKMLDSAPSQWQKSATTGCGCKQRIQVEHKFDASLSALMEGLDVIAFDEADKLYPTGFDYVKASAEGDSLVKYDSGDICIDLLDAKATKIDDFKGRTPVVTSAQGDIEVTLSWNNGADYDLELDMPGSVRDVQSCSMEHAYVYSEFEIYPGRYPVNVTQASTGNVSGVYYVSIATPGESKVIKVDANTTGHMS